jgi:diguanylate cyclase (GGDEF)-like protein/PAS domain S-box-containing protein
MSISILRRSARNEPRDEGVPGDARLIPQSATPEQVGDFPPSLHRMLSVLTDGVAVVNGRGELCHANDNLIELSGHSYGALVGQPARRLFPTWERDTKSARVEVAAGQPSFEAVDIRLDLCRGNGKAIEVLAAISPFVFDGERWVVVLVRDARLISAAEKLRVATELRFRLAFEGNLAPMTVTNLDDQISAANRAFCDMVGFSKEELIGHDSKVFTFPDDVGITEESHRRAISGETEQSRYIKRYLRKDGKVIFVEVLRSAARDEAGELLYFVFSERDITQEKALSAQITHQSLHDPLTGLANRALFMDRLSQGMARVARKGGTGAVLLLDLDNFQGVNDTYGHVIGDQLLVAIAHRLDVVARTSDSLARSGDDEFLYLAEGMSAPEDAAIVAKRMLDVFSQPFVIDGTPLEQRVSMGVVVWDAANSDCAEIVQNADVALFEAKRAGKDRYVIFSPDMQEQAVDRFELVQDLRRGFQSNQFAMHYQPIVDLATTTVVGFEALMRWEHPERGMVPPAVFIPLAEQSDLILELGTFALESAIEAASSWSRSGDPSNWPYVSVNLSARQFYDPDLVTSIEKALYENDLGPERLIIEVTESVALANVAETMNVIDYLNRLGVGFALDDFGTGYSSLSYLALMRPRVIKIDQSFVSPAFESARNDTLLEAIVSLGQNLNMSVLAEGIETQGQYIRLCCFGCELGQGFLFSPAVSADVARTMVGRVLGT